MLHSDVRNTLLYLEHSKQPAVLSSVFILYLQTMNSFVKFALYYLQRGTGDDVTEHKSGISPKYLQVFEAGIGPPALCSDVKSQT